MASNVVLLSLGLIFIEDAISFLLQNSAVVGRVLTKYVTEHCMPKYSVVRKIGSNLTWIQANRLHVVWQKEISENGSLFGEYNDLECYNGVLENTDQNRKNTEHLETKVEELEKELCNLQAQVAKILLLQEKKLCTDDKIQLQSLQASSSESVVSSSTSFVPPPPPPMPSTPFLPSRTVLVQVKPKTVNLTKEKESSFSIMEELSKMPPKLRHVERSPGGRPVRNIPLCSDPSNILTAVLKKRFEAIHSPKQESCLVSPPRTP